MAIDCLIFSKDRPAQLDLLLRSIDRYAAHLYGSVEVLVAPGLWGYNTAAAEHEDVSFYPDDDFDLSVRDWLGFAGETVSFLCDDDVFYRHAAFPERLPWSYRGGDYDYPFSLDGNVYAKQDVVGLVEAMPPFRNPSELEAFGHELRHLLPFTEVQHGRPCLVGVPLNRVSANSGMPHMGVDPAELNRRYLAGERLQLPRVEGDLPAHAELELSFA